MAWGFIKSLYVLMFYAPKKIISTGGLLSIPVCLAARFLNIPVDLYELNAIPGKASLFLSKLATSIFVTFEECSQHFFCNCDYVEYPLRFSKQDKAYDKAKVLRYLGLDENKKTIFLLGGSQGSILLNSVFGEWVRKNKKFHKDLQIIHQTGAIDVNDWETFYRDLGITHYTFEYSDDIKPHQI